MYTDQGLFSLKRGTRGRTRTTTQDPSIISNPPMLISSKTTCKHPAHLSASQAKREYKSFCFTCIRKQLVSKCTIMKNFPLGWAEEVERGWQEAVTAERNWHCFVGVKEKELFQRKQKCQDTEARSKERNWLKI